MAAEVIIAGGGPVGMLLAAELRLADVEAAVLEQSPEPNVHSRAFRLQPRTLDVLDMRGLLDRFRADNLAWPNAHFAGIKPLLDLSRTGGENPYSLLIPQARTEALLEERAVELGARVLRGHTVTGIADEGRSVAVDVAGPDGEYRLEGSFLVGCDGGRSTVRKAAGVEFPGTGGQVTALLGDVVLDEPEKLPMGVPGTMRTSAGLLMAVALEPGVTRVLVTEFGGPNAGRDAPVTLEELREGVRRVTGHEVAIRDPRWLSRFNDATRLAANYRDNRVLLAGDAAHVHFPIGAQGLNLGMQDAVNLGWKLAAAIKGWAPEGLLDTYGKERRPVARGVLRETRAQLALMNPDEDINPLRELFGELLALDEVNIFLSKLVAGTDVRYEDGGGDADPCPWRGAFAPNLRFKDREGRTRAVELLREGRGVLLAFHEAQDLLRIADAWGDRVDAVAVDAADDAPTPAVLLLRPDGHVAWAADGADRREAEQGLRRALSAWFGSPV